MAGVLRSLVAERRDQGASESRFERALFKLLKKSGLTLPVKQYPVVLDGRACRFDFAYPQAGFAIEALGYANHSDRDDWEDDHDRHNEVMVSGWRVMYVTHRALCRRPEKIIETIKRVLESTAPTFGAHDDQVVARPTHPLFERVRRPLTSLHMTQNDRGERCAPAVVRRRIRVWGRGCAGRLDGALLRSRRAIRTTGPRICAWCSEDPGSRRPLPGRPTRSGHGPSCGPRGRGPR